MAGVPFALRRPALLLRDLLVDRRRPDLAALEHLADPEAFLWAILPHAARSFSACIVLLPAPAARAAAVAYLYCRILDTYEDLSPGPAQAQAALAAFARRFDAPPPLPAAPPLPAPASADARDLAHLLLVRRCAAVDAVHATLPREVAALIARLVSAMAAGMAEASAALAAQGGALADDEQLLRYCRAVLGQPVLFVTALTALRRRDSPLLSPAEEATALEAGEFIQLANVTRDLEKDLARGVAFAPELAECLGTRVDPPDGIPAADGARRAEDAVRGARGRLLDLALARAAAYARLLSTFDELDPRRISLTRASALLMLLFTEHYYAGCARRAGRAVAAPRRRIAALIAAALAAACSRRLALRTRERCLARLAALASTRAS